MKKIFLVYALCVLFCGTKALGAEMVWNEIGRGNSDIKSVLVDPDNAHLIYLGSSRAVLKSEDGGQNWRDILVLRGANSAAHLLVFDPRDRNTVYAATAAGLYRSNNQGKNWSRIFRGSNYLESDCRAIAVLPAAIFLGTKGGLLVSKDQGRS